MSVPDEAVNRWCYPTNSAGQKPWAVISFRSIAVTRFVSTRNHRTAACPVQVSRPIWIIRFSISATFRSSRIQRRTASSAHRPKSTRPRSTCSPRVTATITSRRRRSRAANASRLAHDRPSSRTIMVTTSRKKQTVFSSRRNAVASVGHRSYRCTTITISDTSTRSWPATRWTVRCPVTRPTSVRPNRRWPPFGLRCLVASVRSAPC